MAGLGVLGFVGYAKESSGGTPVAATDYIEAFSENFQLNYDRFVKSNIRGNITAADDIAGIKRIAGDVTVTGDPEQLGHFFNAACGVQSNTVVISGQLNSHEFTIATTDWDDTFALPPYTFEINRDVSSSQQFAGCNVSGLQINITPNNVLQVTASIIGKSELNIAKSTATFTTSPTNPFAFDTCSISWGGAAHQLIESLTISQNGNLEGIASLRASRDVRAIRRAGPTEVTFNGAMAFENIDDYVAFINETERALTVHLTRANSFALTIELPKTVVTAYPVGMGGAERVIVDFEGQGRYSQSDGYSVKYTLYNTTSGY